MEKYISKNIQRGNLSSVITVLQSCNMWRSINLHTSAEFYSSSAKAVVNSTVKKENNYRNIKLQIDPQLLYG